ncbi:MAG: pyrroline-5-carboxylate reductase [Phycisphaeraceae bacterium]|nr:pyrroline-5-carboxylate reductase [Phycisphaeraceae bacterium]
MNNVQVPSQVAPAVRLLVIGGGTMGSALVDAAVGRGVLLPAEVLVCEPDAARRRDLVDRGVRTAADPGVAGPVPAEAQVLLAVKPQAFAAAASQWAATMRGPGRRRVVVSIMAGLSAATVADGLAKAGVDAAVIRAMPNTPARIGRGVTALSVGAGVRVEEAALARAVFAAAGGGRQGAVVEIDESLMDGFTALAGSGPAYLFLLAEAMVEAGLRCGFSAAEADGVVRGVLAGAAELLAQSGEAPAALRQGVTSRGGTTEAALAVLEARGVREAVAEAIVAGRDRARALGA